MISIFISLFSGEKSLAEFIDSPPKEYIHSYQTISSIAAVNLFLQPYPQSVPQYRMHLYHSISSTFCRSSIPILSLRSGLS